LQQNPDICGIIDFWDGDATGAAAAIRDAKLQDKVFLVTTGGGETVDCNYINDGTFGAVVMTDLAGQSRDMNAIVNSCCKAASRRAPPRPTSTRWSARGRKPISRQAPAGI